MNDTAEHDRFLKEARYPHVFGFTPAASWAGCKTAQRDGTNNQIYDENTRSTMDLMAFTHLGRQSQAPIDEVETVPWQGGPITVRLDCAEFTSLCPVTGQPDFAQLVIEYEPAQRLIETKSLKLYLWRFRDRAAFNEAIVDEIAQDLFRQSQARRLVVTGTFHARGGIALTTTSLRQRQEAAPPAPEQKRGSNRRAANHVQRT